jgi:hypothetical protein
VNESNKLGETFLEIVSKVLLNPVSSGPAIQKLHSMLRLLYINQPFELPANEVEVCGTIGSIQESLANNTGVSMQKTAMIGYY